MKSPGTLTIGLKALSMKDVAVIALAQISEYRSTEAHIANSWHKVYTGI